MGECLRIQHNDFINNTVLLAGDNLYHLPHQSAPSVH